jgi:hypothetical protein
MRLEDQFVVSPVKLAYSASDNVTKNKLKRLPVNYKQNALKCRRKQIMKKLSFVTLVFIGMQAISFAHSKPSTAANTITPCAEEALDNLISDLYKKKINFSLTYNTRLGYIFINIFDNPPPGKVQSSVAHYNNDARNCERALTLNISYR